jgi:hypothetical protein
MMSIISIAGIPMEISSKAPFKITRRLKRFLSNETKQFGLKVSLGYSNNFQLPGNAQIIDDMLYWSNGDKRDDEITIAICDPETNQVNDHLKVNKEWDNAVITSRSTKKGVLYPFYESLGEIIFRNCLLFHHGIVIHAAAIECDGLGLLFSAPSGTGKTTQANLWKKYKKAKIINADRPAIRVIGSEPFVYGTLWNGSSKKCSNRSVPLSAIVLLEQWEDNVICKLEKKEAIERLMPRCFLPYYQEDIMNLALDNIEQIINQTPVYLLKCRPDLEAVELVYQCVK